jgi:hypothetical protein
MTEPRREPARVVWSYWEDKPGGKQLPYLDLCLETLRRHAGDMELRVLGAGDVAEWVPDLDAARWRALPAPNYRSDYARSRVLFHHGGIWADPDTIAVGGLGELLAALDERGVVGWGKEEGRFFGGLCAAAPGAPLVGRWLEAQDEVLDAESSWEALDYAALAQGITWSLARRFPWKALPSARLAPIPWHQWRRFFSHVESPVKLFEADPITVVLWNAVMHRRLVGRDRQELLRGTTLLSRLLRIGLGLSSPGAEEDLLTRFHVLSELRFSLPGQRVETAFHRAATGLPRAPFRSGKVGSYN